MEQLGSQQSVYLYQQIIIAKNIIQPKIIPKISPVLKEDESELSSYFCSFSSSSPANVIILILVGSYFQYNSFESINTLRKKSFGELYIFFIKIKFTSQA